MDVQCGNLYTLFLLCNIHTLGTGTEARASRSESSQLTLSAAHSAQVSYGSRGYVRLVLCKFSVRVLVWVCKRGVQARCE